MLIKVYTNMTDVNHILRGDQIVVYTKKGRTPSHLLNVCLDIDKYYIDEHDEGNSFVVSKRPYKADD